MQNDGILTVQRSAVEIINTAWLQWYKIKAQIV